MSTDNTTIDDNERDYSAFRFGQAIDDQSKIFIADRDPYGRLIVAILPREAMDKGFAIVDRETEEPHPKSQEIWSAFEPQWEEFLKAVEIRNRDGLSYCAILESNNPAKKKAPFLRAVPKSQVWFNTLSFYNDRSLRTISITDKRYGIDSDKNFHFGDREHLAGLIGDEDPDKALKEETVVNEIDNIRMFITSTKEEWWKGRSKLEVVWDIIWGLRAIHMGCSLYFIRVGAGLKVIVFPEGADDSDIADIRDANKKMESFNRFFIIPKEAQVEVQTGTVLDYNSGKDALLRALSAVLKIPKARLDGIEPGQIEGAKVNEQQMFDVWRREQRESRLDVRWMVERFNEYYDWGIAEDFWKKWKIEFDVRGEPDETAAAELLSMNVQSYVAAINANLISIENAQEELGFPVEEVENPVPSMGLLTVKGENENESVNEENSDQGPEETTGSS